MSTMIQASGASIAFETDYKWSQPFLRIFRRLVGHKNACGDGRAWARSVFCAFPGSLQFALQFASVQ